MVTLTKEYLLTTKKKIMEFTKKPMETNTQGNGKTIKLMVKENLFGKMEILMKDHGFKTKEMDSENLLKKMKNIQAIGLMIKKKEKGK